MLDLKHFFKQFDLFSDIEISDFLQSGTEKVIKKGTFLIEEGAVSNNFAFVKSGIFRSFYYSTNSEEVTYCFTFPNSFAAAYSSLITQEPSKISIQAITDMTLVYFEKESLEERANKHWNWQTYMRLVAQSEYLLLEKRFFQMQKEKADTRYQDLLTNQPEYILQIPLNYLASYLGVTQRHLSRIRKIRF